MPPSILTLRRSANNEPRGPCGTGIYTSRVGGMRAQNCISSRDAELIFLILYPCATCHKVVPTYPLHTSSTKCISLFLTLSLSFFRPFHFTNSFLSFSGPLVKPRNPQISWKDFYNILSRLILYILLLTGEYFKRFKDTGYLSRIHHNHID